MFFQSSNLILQQRRYIDTRLNPKAAKKIASISKKK